MALSGSWLFYQLHHPLVGLSIEGLLLQVGLQVHLLVVVASLDHHLVLLEGVVVLKLKLVH